MRTARLLSSSSSTPPALANFDSTTAFVRANARFLRGEGFPRLGMLPRPLVAVMPVANYLPRRTKQWLYRRSGASEAVSPAKLDDVDVEAFRRWVTDQYLERGYPAVLVGSANGAAIHLAALLGVPWLPQTFLVPVRRSLPPDAARADLEWGREPGRRLLEANPDVQLHQMHDPNQDRLMVQELAYFRVKVRRLGLAYREFLEKTLAPGGRIIVIDCGCRWPATRVGDRHVFQFGGLGGLQPREYISGSDRVRTFLAEQNAARIEWDPPEPDERAPESEWGFEPALRDGVVEFADERGHRVREISFDNPRDLSGLVADLYGDQYAEREFDTDRLFVQDFTLIDPWWTVRTGSVPFWIPFNANAAVESVERYLEDRSSDVDELYLTLFSNGIDAVGQASIDRWRTLLDSARTRGSFVGVDPTSYPLDFGSYVRYRSALPGTIPARQPMLPPPSLDEFETRIAEHARRNPVAWTEQ